MPKKEIVVKERPSTRTEEIAYYLTTKLNEGQREKLIEILNLKLPTIDRLSKFAYDNGLKLEINFIKNKKLLPK